MRTLFNARHPMGRLPQLFGHAAVAAGLLAGGASLLNAGGAMAAFCNGTSGTQFDLTTIAGPPNPSIDCASPVAGNNLLVTVDTDFAPPVELPGPATGHTSFKIKSLHGPFLSAFLDLDTDFGTATVVKEVFADSSLAGTPLLTLTSTGAQVSGPLSDQTLKELWVKDTYTVLAGSQLDNYTNTFESVPGPLPILGAGAAFGFSRKLRGRIKASRTA